MKGLELSEKFYERYGRAMLERFPGYEERIAVGLVGSGSECFGYDDAVSQDHDFAPGFCLWLTREDDAEIGFALMEAYQALPQEFMGLSLRAKSGGSERRHGVFTIEEFYSACIGLPGAPQNWREWFYLPEYALATAVNGRIFRDDLKKFSAIREDLLAGYPRDVFMKKLAGRLALMAQSGQYNYRRCRAHGELGASALALHEFVDHALHLLFLLNNRYAPFYKWRFRAARELPFLGNLAERLESLVIDGAKSDVSSAIEEICAVVMNELHRRDLSFLRDRYLENHALSVTKQICDPEIRALHLMEIGE